MTKARNKNASGLPKRIAGVKVPKAVRKAKGLRGLLASDLGREILADVLIAAAGAAAAAISRSRTARPAVADSGATAPEPASDAARATDRLVETATGALAGVVTDAARGLLPSALTAESGERPRYLSKTSGLENRKRSKPLKEGGAGRKHGKARD